MNASPQNDVIVEALDSHSHSINMFEIDPNTRVEISV